MLMYAGGLCFGCDGSSVVSLVSFGLAPWTKACFPKLDSHKKDELADLAIQDRPMKMAKKIQNQEFYETNDEQ